MPLLSPQLLRASLSLTILLPLPLRGKWAILYCGAWQLPAGSCLGRPTSSLSLLHAWPAGRVRQLQLDLSQLGCQPVDFYAATAAFLTKRRAAVLGLKHEERWAEIR